MRLWIKAWQGILRDPAIIAQPSAGFAYFRLVYESSATDGKMPQALLQAMAVALPDLELLTARGYIRATKDGGLEILRFLQEQAAETQIQGLTERAVKGAHARWNASSIASSNAKLEVRSKKKKEEEEEEPELPTASPPVVSNFKKALNQMAENAGPYFDPLPDGVDVEASEAIRFNKTLWKKYPPSHDAWPVLGKWLAAGGRPFGNSLTSKDILRDGATYIAKALSWEAQGSPDLGSSKNGFPVRRKPEPTPHYYSAYEEQKKWEADQKRMNGTSH